MPIVKVWLLPTKKEAVLMAILKAITDTILEIPELQLRKSDITIIFPTDLLKNGLGEEIIVEITGLYEKPERTPQVLQNLAQKVGQKVQTLYPKSKVECIIQSFDPAQGFWSSSG
jgi:energy-converting hydrogenase Eha subunit A